jgi:hypothetical protein
MACVSSAARTGTMITNTISSNTIPNAATMTYMTSRPTVAASGVSVTSPYALPSRDNTARARLRGTRIIRINARTLSHMLNPFELALLRR